MALQPIYMTKAKKISSVELDKYIKDSKNLGIIYGAGVSAEVFGTFRKSGNYQYNIDDMTYNSQSKNNSKFLINSVLVVQA